MKKLIRYFFVLTLLTALAPAAIAQTICNTIEKEYHDFIDSYCHFYYNKSTNSIRMMEYEISDDRNRCAVTIYSDDLKSIWKQFTLIAPNGYKISSIETINFAQFCNSFQASDDIFNKDDLVELIVCLKKSDEYEWKYSLMNENSKVLLEFPSGPPNGCYSSDGGRFIWYYKSQEKRYSYKFFVIDTNATAGINDVKADEHSSIVSPNPSNGAASVEVSWDYTLLDDAQLNVMNMDGKLLHTQAVKSGTRKTSLSTSRFPAGTYIYVVHGSNGYTSTGKFIIN